MINNFFSLLILIGISISVIYLTLEGIIQGLKKFKILSGVNFFFYTLSLNIPSISLYFFEEFNYVNLITLSLFIKITVIFIIFLYLKSFIRNKEKLKYNLFLKLTKYSKWYFLHLVNLQIFDFADKYLIKILIGPIALAIYSIPYQLAGKITIFSKSISAVLLPEISEGKEKSNFNYSINIYTFIIPVLLLYYTSFIVNAFSIFKLSIKNLAR